MESDKNICKVCNKPCLTGAERISCMGPCKRGFHTKCLGFTPVSLSFYRNCSNLSYECDECRDNPYRMINKALDKILSFMCIFNERLNRQEQNSESVFKHFETLNDNLKQFNIERRAEINKEKITVNDNTSSVTKVIKITAPHPVVLVKPKTKQKCSATRAILNEKNIPNQIAINSVNNLPNGGVEIQCENKSDVVKLQEKAIVELGEEYTIIIPNRRNPKIRVTNMSEKQTNVDIIASIKKHNESMKDADVKVLHVFEVKHNETYGAIIELDSRSFNALMTKNKVVIGPDICNITESVSVLRCYNCCGYNHKSNICKNKKACLRCGGEHVVRECKATKNECVNCKIASEKLRLDIDWNHPAWSKSCTVLQRNIERERLRTKYSE